MLAQERFGAGETVAARFRSRWYVLRWRGRVRRVTVAVANDVVVVVVVVVVVLLQDRAGSRERWALQ